jgi:hypothetical protein
MSDVYIKGGLTQENAILLLAAVEELGGDPSEVRTTLKGFVTSKKIADKAGVESYDPDADFNAEIAEAEKEVAAKPEPEDGVIAAGEAPPVLDDEGNLVVESNEPPRSGKGSGVEAWRDYAKTQGAEDDEVKDASREELIEKYGNKE